MTFLAAALALCLISLFATRSAFAGQPGSSLSLSGFHGIGVLMVFAIYCAATLALGPTYAIALLAAVQLHELGHVIAYRMLGHEQVRLRMVPLPFFSQSITDTPLKTQLGESFVALMGAGFSVGPMVLGYAIATTLAQDAPMLANAAGAFAIACGALNMVSLLPFLPLDGGRAINAVTHSVMPVLGPAMACFMIAAFAMAAMRQGSLALGLLAAMGVQSLLPRPAPTQEPLKANEALLVLAAYTFIFATHFTSGWWLLKELF